MSISYVSGKVINQFFYLLVGFIYYTTKRTKMWAKKREGGGGGWTGNIFMKKKKDPADLPMPSSFHRLRAAVPLLVEVIIQINLALRFRILSPYPTRF